MPFITFHTGTKMVADAFIARLFHKTFIDRLPAFVRTSKDLTFEGDLNALGAFLSMVNGVLFELP